MRLAAPVRAKSVAVLRQLCSCGSPCALIPSAYLGLLEMLRPGVLLTEGEPRGALHPVTYPAARSTWEAVLRPPRSPYGALARRCSRTVRRPDAMRRLLPVEP